MKFQIILKEIVIGIIAIILCGGCPADKNKINDNLQSLFKDFNGDYISYICIRRNSSVYICVVNTKLNEQKIFSCDNESCRINKCSNEEVCFKSITEK